jgi:hypothetical protein
MTREDLNQIVTKVRNAERKDAKSYVHITTLFPRPRPNDKGEKNYEVKVKITAGSNKVTVLGAISENMAIQAMRIVLRRIQKALYSGTQMFEQQAQELGNIGPCQVSNICARYVPQSKDIKISLAQLCNKYKFGNDIECSGPGCRRMFYDDQDEKIGQVTLFENCKMLFLGFSSPKKLLDVFSMVQSMCKDCNKGNFTPFCQELIDIDSAQDRDRQGNVWAKKRRNRDPTPMEEARRARKRVKTDHKIEEKSSFDWSKLLTAYKSKPKTIVKDQPKNLFSVLNKQHKPVALRLGSKIGRLKKELRTTPKEETKNSSFAMDIETAMEQEMPALENILHSTVQDVPMIPIAPTEEPIACTFVLPDLFGLL